RDQFVACRLVVALGRDRRAEAKDNRPRPDAPPALGQDSARAQYGHGDDLYARPEGEHEGALLERQQLARRRARAFGEDDDGAVVAAQATPGLVERLDGRRAIAPVDRNVSRGFPGLPEERDRAQLLLRHETVAFRDEGGECPDVVPRDVVRREDLRPVVVNVLKAFEVDGRAARPQHPPAPRPARPVVDAATDPEEGTE